MRIFFCVLLSATLVLGGYALGATPTTTASATAVDAKAKKTKKCVFPKSMKRAPSWVCNGRADGLAVTAVGSAAKSGAGISFMEQMAAADARVHLARNLHGSIKISGKRKISGSKDSATGVAADQDSALITDASLEGTKIIKSAYGPDGTLYVLVGLDEASAQKLRESIAADHLKHR